MKPLRCRDSEDSFPLLLTATIKLHPRQLASDGDPDIRRREYGEVLRWLAARPCGIREFVFCENSGADLGDFEEIQKLFERQGLKLRLVSCETPANVSVPGKGWGEGWTVETALSKCPELNSSSGFYKLTGRYKLMNMHQVLKCVRRARNSEDKPDFICGSFQVTHKGPYSGTAFFWTTGEFYKEKLMTAYRAVNDHSGVYLEHIFGSRLLELASAYRIGVLPVSLILNGISGFSGRPFMTSTQRVRAAIGNFTRYRRKISYIS